MGSNVFLVLVVFSGLAPLCFALTDVSSVPATSEHAWVTIFYEGTPRDYEYFLGARVALYSMWRRGSRQDRIVFVSPNVRQEYREQFEADGVKVIEVENLVNPYTHNAKYLPRFQYSLNKLYAWGLTQYRRVVMVDADVIAVSNPDELFLCGHFCALFMNPCHFHTGLLVIKPDLNMFQRLVDALQVLPSHDAADQGFLDNFFSDLIDAPMFNASRGRSERPVERLNIGYNMHHLYYYEKFNWELYSCSPIVTLGYPIHQNFKPWYWWTYPLLDINWWWQDLRMELPGQSFHYLPRTLLVITLFGFAYLLLRYAIPVFPAFYPRMVVSHARVLSYVYGLLAALVCIRLSLELVSVWLPPQPAWILFLAHYQTMFYFLLALFGFFLYACCAQINHRPTMSSVTRAALLHSTLYHIVKFLPVYFLFWAVLSANIYGNIIYKAAAALTITVLLIWMQGSVAWTVAQVYLKNDAAAASLEVTATSETSKPHV